VQLGRPIPSNLGNANTWDNRARAAGYRVDHTPSVGAVFQTDAGYFGHVGVVERINPDGSIVISEMNNRAYGGWGKTNTRTIYNPGDYTYIH
jgi:surface antigen